MKPTTNDDDGKWIRCGWLLLLYCIKITTFLLMVPYSQSHNFLFSSGFMDTTLFPSFHSIRFDFTVVVVDGILLTGLAWPG